MELETWKIDSVTYLLCKDYSEYAVWWAGCRVTPWVKQISSICEGELLDKCYDAIEELGEHSKYQYNKVECVTVDDVFGYGHEVYLGLEE